MSGMDQSEKIRIILLEEFVKAQTRNPHYSMRAYAKKLGLSQSAVSEMLSGKRTITQKSARRIISAITGNEPDEALALLDSIEEKNTHKFHPVNVEDFDIISDWHHYAILSLTETKDFQSSEAWIAERLGIDEELTSNAIKNLLRLEMLQKDDNGQLRSTNKQFEFITSIPSIALRKANGQNLELALKALEKVPLTLRDFTAITLCFDPARIEDGRKMIKNFRRQFNRVMEAGHKKEVYKLCIQLFPLSRRDS